MCKNQCKTGYGIDELLHTIENALPQTRKRVRLLLPFDKIGIAGKIRQDGVLHSEQYTENGLELEVTADISFLDTIKEYII